MSADVPPDERVSVLLHELRHCWGFHIPKTRGEEDECDLLAMIAESAYADLERQGGIDRLKEMKPDSVAPDHHWVRAIMRPKIMERLNFIEDHRGNFHREEVLIAILDSFDAMTPKKKMDALMRTLNLSGKGNNLQGLLEHRPKATSPA